MNPEQSFIDSRRRVLGDLSPESYMYQKFQTFSLEIVTMVVIICLLLITALYSCFLSLSNRLSDHRQNHDHQASTPSQALNHPELEANPVFTYGAMSLPPFSIMSSEYEICAICLDEYVQEDTIRVLQRCKHMFHKDCIDKWLHMRSLNCPICRDSAVEQSVEVARTCCQNGATVGNNTYSLARIAFTANAGRPSVL